ncbi:MAG: hypothetical protein ACFFDN_48805 [Candidatus Hodarchaeota archaeon]
MEANSINSKVSHTHSVNICGICRAEITNEASIYQEGLHLGVVCADCYKNNSKEDLELMANMFFAYGGYFGMLKEGNFSVYKVLKELTSEIEEQETSLDEINVKMMHRALLHGITLHQFIEGLKLFLEK